MTHTHITEFNNNKQRLIFLFLGFSEIYIKYTIKLAGFKMSTKIQIGECGTRNTLQNGLL